MSAITSNAGEAKSQTGSSTPVLVGLGNPLLDISAEVPQSVFDQYGLAAGNAILAEEKHMPLYDEMVKNYSVDYIAGGATQNSIRVAQWMLDGAMDGATAYVGCVGDDDFARELRASAEGAGVKCLYKVDSNTPTGTCAVLIKDAERSLVANLAAANNYNIEHFNGAEVTKLVNDAKFFYMAGFFMTHSADTMLKLGEHANANDKVFMLNLAAPFIVQFFSEPLDKLIEHVDYLFANESEAAAFAAHKGWEGVSVAECARRAARLPKKSGSRPRVVVFTQGSESTVVACNGEVLEFPVTQLPREALVDTNGAGDAFVGGFLSQLIQGKSLAQCVEAGHYSARVIIQRSGCTYPDTPEFVASSN